MQMSRRGSGPVAPAFEASLELANRDRAVRQRRTRQMPRLLAGTLLATSICLSTAQAANFGHSRIVSALGQPLHLEIPITGLTQQEIDSLRAAPAPLDAWKAAGMSPPVPLESMRLVLLDGIRPDVKLIQLRSDRPFEQSIVDVLLDVRSASGQQRYQVSLVAHADTDAIHRAGVNALDSAQTLAGSHAAAGRKISVRRGDNMFAIAQRNAVQGVTVYQMMMALQRSNPQAFIQDNVNLVKAGATLTMPDMDVLTALSDREARRLFLQHAQAFALYRQRGGTADMSAASTVLAAAEGEVTEPVTAGQATPLTPATGGDRLRLSGSPTAAAQTDTSTSAGSATSADIPASPSGGPGGTASGQPAGVAATPSSGSGLSTASTALNSAVAGSSSAAADSTGSPGKGIGPVSLLANSGAIASDALIHEAPHAASGDTPGRQPFGSDAGTSGTVLSAGGNPQHPDDEAALLKGVDESKKRILELEDNVRHLNEALQKQGHVAAEAALEGARSVTEVLKEVMSLVEPEDGGNALANGGDGTSAGSETVAGQAPTDSAVGGAKGTSDGSNQAGGNALDGAGAPGSAETQPAEAGNHAESGASAAAGATGAKAASAGLSESRGVEGRSAGTDARGSSSSAGSLAVGSDARGESGSQSGTRDAGSTAAAPGAKPASWFKENLLALGGAALALIVLVAVWLLRRAAAAKDEAFENEIPITDSMLQEKLRDIDLDLNHPPSGGSRSS